MEIFYIVLSAAIGFTLGFILKKSKEDPNAPEIQSLNQQNALQAQSILTLEKEKNELRSERDSVRSRNTTLERDLSGEQATLKTLRTSYSEQIATLKSKNEEYEKLLESEKKLVSTLTSRSVQAEATLKAEQEKYSKLEKSTEEVKSQLKIEFQNLSNSIFEDKTKKLTTLNETSIDSLLKPVKDNLLKLDQFNRELEQKRIGAYSSLEAHIKSLVESENFLRTETAQLVKALRQPTTRGTWGEQQLRRVLEIAGMEEHVHFNEQVPMSIGGKNLRADLVLHMADGKHIVVDSKAPIEIYLSVVNASSQEEQQDRMKSLTANIKSYAKDLQSKEYWRYYGDSPGVVVMFIPGESMLNAAMQFDATLWDECVKRRVLLASPTTLIAILYSIHFGWRQESFEKNAEQIRKAGENIYEKLSIFGSHLVSLGSNLEKSVGKYNDAIGSLEHTVLPSARKIKELGVNTGDKALPNLTPIETELRSVHARELLSAKEHPKQ